MRAARPSFSEVPGVFKQSFQSSSIPSQDHDQISPDPTPWTLGEASWTEFDFGFYQANQGLTSQGGYLPSPTETVSTFEELETPPCYFDYSPSVMPANVFDHDFGLALGMNTPDSTTMGSQPEQFKLEAPQQPQFLYEGASCNAASTYSLFSRSPEYSPPPLSTSSPTEIFLDIPDFQQAVSHSRPSRSHIPTREVSPASSVSSSPVEFGPVASPHPAPSTSSSDNKRRFPCSIPGCTRRFTSQYTLSVHLQAHRPKPRPSFPCTAGCSEKFSRAHDRLRHEVAKHAKVCEHSCLDCGRFFSSERTLGNHRCPNQIS